MLLILSGCSSTSFLGSRFDNFSAYYNKYYNAERSLNEGVRKFEEGLELKAINQDVFLSLFGRSEQASTQRKPFEDAVTKSADILRKHPNSKWVDDAIMIIGKAWFFTLNFVGAEEKFNDVLELDSPLRDEANFWLARTLIAGGNYEQAFTHLQTVLSIDDLPGRWEARYRLALAELHVQSENWEEAAAELELGIENLRDRSLASRAQFLEGQVLEQLDRYPEAAAAYDRVQRYKPFYELSYAAQFSAIRIRGDHLDPEQAMQQLRRMERDDKNYDHRAELAYLKGRILIALGRYSEALEEYDELLYDPTSGGARVQGRVHYALGSFYRDIVLDYPFAAAHFDTASSAIKSSGQIQAPARAGSIPPKPSANAITDDDDQAEMFGSFSEVLDQIILMDSLLYLGTLDDSSFLEVVLELRQRRADEMEKIQREMQQRQSEFAFRGNSGFAGDDLGPVTEIAGWEGEAGFLYHRDDFQMMQARQDFVLIWGDRPLAPNWRRIAAIELPQTDVTEDGQDDLQSQQSTGRTLPMVDVSAVPRTPETFDDMLTNRAKARYELGNVLFLSMNLPDSASAWYRMVIEEDEDETVLQRAYYALAEVQRALGDSSAANRLYEVVIADYPVSDLTDQAYSRLGRPVPNRALTDSLTLSEEAYKQSLKKWQQALSEEVVGEMFALGLQWSTTPVAPRALYAAGTAYLELAARDSLDILAELPVSVDAATLDSAGFYPKMDSTSTAADSLLTLPLMLDYIQTSFLNSPQREMAGLLLSALQEEKDQRQAVLDSLQHIADSLAAPATLTMTDDSLRMQNVDSLIRSDSLNLTEAAGVDSLQQFNLPGDSLQQAVLVDSLIDSARTGLNPFRQIHLSVADEIEGRPEQEVKENFAEEPSSEVEPERSDALLRQEPPLRLPVVSESNERYTIRIMSYPDRELAESSVVNLRRSLGDIEYPLRVFEQVEETGLSFGVGLGLFQTVQEAESALEQLQMTDQIPVDSKILSVPITQE